MKPKHVYLVLCAAGAVLPYTQFLPWVLDNGLNPRLALQDLFANHISAFFAADVLVSAVVVFVFLAFERDRVGRRWWLVVAATLAAGVSLGLPLLLYLRERERGRAMVSTAR